MTTITHCFSMGLDQRLYMPLTREERDPSLWAYLNWAVCAEDYAKANDQSVWKILSQLCAKWGLQHVPIPGNYHKNEPTDDAECSQCTWVLFLKDTNQLAVFWHLHQPTPRFASIAIREAAKTGCTPLLRFLLQDDRIDTGLLTLHPAHTKLDEGQNALHVACSSGQAEAAKELLAWEATQEFPGDVNERSDGGYTALAYAALNGHVDVVRLLLETPGVDCNAPNDEGESPLYLAASKGRTQVVTALLGHPEVLVETMRWDGRTALLQAAGEGHDTVVSLLLADGRANPNHRLADGFFTPSVMAITGGYTQVVRVLLADSRLDVHAPLFGKGWSGGVLQDGESPKGWFKTPLKTVLKRERAKASRYMNITILHLAVIKGHTEIVRVLLQDGRLNPNDKDGPNEMNLLILAATVGNLDVIKTLLDDPRVEVNVSSTSYGTPLRVAATEGHADIVELLLARGADPNANGGYLRSRPLEKAAKQVQKPPKEWLQDRELGRVKVKGCLKAIEILLAHPGVDKKGFKMPKVHPVLE